MPFKPWPRGLSVALVLTALGIGPAGPGPAAFGSEPSTRKEAIAKALDEVNRELAESGGGSWQTWGE